MRLGAVRVLLAAAVAVGLALVPAPAAADPAGAAPTSATLAKIDSYLEAEVAERGLPGVAFTLVRGRSVLALRALGRADESGRALTPRTPVLLASLSKSITATAVLQLVEAGKVRLDQPVSTYLPWFRATDGDRPATITVAELLHHTSGIPENPRGAFGALDDGSAAALEQGVRWLGTVSLASTPGTEYLYSNTNYNLLGAIVEAVTGEPFADYLTRHVFEPAGMRDASVGLPPGDAAAGYYRWYGGAFRPTTVPLPASMTPSAIMYASAADLAQLLIMNLNDGQVGGARILGPESVAALHRPAVAEDDFTAYAMGWHVRPGWEYNNPIAQTTEAELPTVVEHEGSWSTTRTFIGILPRDEIGFALLINANQPAAESELTSMYTGIWRILAGQEPRDYPAGESLLQQYGWQIAAAILVALGVGLGWSLRVLHRARADQTYPTSRLVVTLIAMLALDVGVAALIWLYLPVAFDTPTYAIARMNPDVGILIGAITALLLWAPVRSVLGLIVLRRRFRRPKSEHAAS